MQLDAVAEKKRGNVHTREGGRTERRREREAERKREIQRIDRVRETQKRGGGSKVSLNVGERKEGTKRGRRGTGRTKKVI